MRRILLAFCLATVTTAAQAQDVEHRAATPIRGTSQTPAPVATVLKTIAIKIAPGAAQSSPAHSARSRQVSRQVSHRITVAAAPATTPDAARATALMTPRVLRETLRHSRISQCTEGKRIITAYYAEGRRTANGERFNPNGLTAAHRTLPFGTRIKVINPRTGQSVLVRINDRGPFVKGVTLDLSRGAAQAIGMRGTGAVCLATL